MFCPTEKFYNWLLKWSGSQISYQNIGATTINRDIFFRNVLHQHFVIQILFIRILKRQKCLILILYKKFIFSLFIIKAWGLAIWYLSSISWELRYRWLMFTIGMKHVDSLRTHGSSVVIKLGGGWCNRASLRITILQI